MGEMEHILSILDTDGLKDLIRSLDSEIGHETVMPAAEDFMRKRLNHSEERVRDRVQWALASYDDYIFMETNMVGASAEELFPEVKSSSMIAEKIFEIFYDEAELMVELGMRDEAMAFIRNIADGIRNCYQERSAVILGLAGDFPLRYADILEESFGTDDILKGFGKR